jgi:SAM-dependent methyltransferase
MSPKDAAHDHPARGRFNAWFLDLLDGYMHRKCGEMKSRMFGALPPTVVEIGPGAGANLRYYPRGTRLIAIEPNVHMHHRLRQKAFARGIDLVLQESGGEAIDLPSASVDFVCSTLTLCTVSDPAAVVAEARRVLRPGGRFVCIEHVAAPNGSRVAALQRALRRPWRWLFEGCDLCRDLDAVVKRAGFRETRIERFEVPTVFLTVRHQIAASCLA